MTTTDQLPAAELSEAAKAAVVDANFMEVLRRAQLRGTATPMTTAASIRAGKAAMKLGRENAARVLSERVARHELVTEGEMVALLHVGQEWIAGALADHRLFFFLGPDEVNYFPSFYGDTTLDRKALEQVSAKLGHVPGPAKYQFFFTRSTLLRSKTPLEALRAGRLADVLIAADGYANS